MNQHKTRDTKQKDRFIGNYDKPIPKPSDDYLEKFLRATEARLTTKRFNTDSVPLPSSRNIKRSRPQ